MKVLLTGFEPFKKEKVNPSWEVCKKMREQKIEGVDITVEQLPVIYDEARKKAIDLCDKIRPDLVIHLGEAGGRTHISMERIGINCDEAEIRDNKKQKREGQPIEPEGKDGYFVTIPVREVMEALKKADIPAVISNSAGTYLCNHVLYGTLHHVKERNLPTKVGFIHLPYLPQQAVDKPGKASMSLDLMVEAITICIKVAK